MKKTIIILMFTLSCNIFAQNWSLTGNSGTNSSTNFIGTTDNQYLTFKINNQKKMVLA